ncbi:Endoplasmic reticulum chaperone BiP [Plecturocebus cupreus]
MPMLPRTRTKRRTWARWSALTREPPTPASEHGLRHQAAHPPTWNDPSVQQDIKFLPFKVVEKKTKSFIQVDIGGQATKDAGTIAELNVMKTINEPKAYGLDKRERKKSILVFHWLYSNPKYSANGKEFFNGKEPSHDINSDEAVAYGAAVQAGMLSGVQDIGDLVLLNVCSLTLGIETVGGVMIKWISRNTVVATKRSQIFSTASDNQPTVIINVYEGEQPLIKDNHLLDPSVLTEIAPAPCRVPHIEITFETNVNGIL